MMSQQILNKCDICDNLIEDKKEKFRKTIQIIFKNEQTEGYPCKPYLSNDTIDICDNCYEYILEGNYLFGKGAQGCNKYYFKE